MGCSCTKSKITPITCEYGIGSDEFHEHAKELLEVIIRHRKQSRMLPPMPNVQPGFLRKFVPTEPPQEPELWHQVLHDVEHVILKGVSTKKKTKY